MSSSLTLRKGGIREPGKHFALEHDRFFLYPTFDHQRNDLVRESHQPELRRALEEGVWPDGEPPPHALTMDGGIPQPDRVRIRAWAEVAGAWTVTDRRAVDALSPFHVWTTDYAEKRLRWKRRHPLHVLLLRTYRIPRPVTVRVRDDYGGCRSWLEITRDLPFEGTPVLSDEEFDRASEEIAAIAEPTAPRLRLSWTARRGGRLAGPRRSPDALADGLGGHASETFVARHDERDEEDAARVLAQLEFARTRLEERFQTRPGSSGRAALLAPPSSTPRSRGCRCAPADRARGAPLRRRLGRPRELHVLARGCSPTARRTSRARWRC